MCRSAASKTLFVPAGTPPEIVRKLSADVAKILYAPDVADRWNQAGYLPVDDASPEQLAAWFARASAKWGRLVRERSIKID